MKIHKKIIAAALAFIMLVSTTLLSGALNVPLQAPWLSAAYMHLSTCKFSADGASGEENQVRFHITYDGDPDTFSHARLTLRLQKRVWGMFWKNVSITDTVRMTEEAITLQNGVWQSENRALHGTFSDVILVGAAGEYRVIFTVETFGQDGTVERVEQNMVIRSVPLSTQQPNTHKEPATPDINESDDTNEVPHVEPDDVEKEPGIIPDPPTEPKGEEQTEEQPPLEYGVLERGEGYVIYDSAMFGEMTLYCEEIVLPADGESLLYDTPIELFRTEETGYFLPVTGVSRDGDTWRFSTPLTEAPFLETSEFKLHFLTADHKVTVMFHCDVDENRTPNLSEDGTVTYLARATDKNGEAAYWEVAENFEKALGHKVEEGKSYFRVYTVKAPPLHW